MFSYEQNVEFGQLILRKWQKIAATRSYILKLYNAQIRV